MTENTQNPSVSQETQTATVDKLTNNKEIIAYLVEKFPRCFILEGEAKPLKINIFKELSEALADSEKVSKTQLRQALRQYTSNWRYLHGCREGAQRIDLNGEPCGLLEAEHVEYATQKLAEAKAKLAERRAAEKAERVAKAKAKKKVVAAKKATKPQVKKRPALVAVDLKTLQKGNTVKVKVGERAQDATILEVSADNARVEFKNGLIMNVSADRVFA